MIDPRRRKSPSEAVTWETIDRRFQGDLGTEGSERRL